MYYLTNRRSIFLIWELKNYCRVIILLFSSRAIVHCILSSRCNLLILSILRRLDTNRKDARNSLQIIYAKFAINNESIIKRRLWQITSTHIDKRIRISRTSGIIFISFSQSIQKRDLRNILLSKRATLKLPRNIFQRWDNERYQVFTRSIILYNT